MSEEIKHPLAKALTAKSKQTFFGMDPGKGIQGFFQLNAFLSILVLGLITLTLFGEAKEFFPQNRASLQLYRLAGLEFVDFVRSQVSDHRELNRFLQEIRRFESADLQAAGADRAAVRAQLRPYDRFVTRFDETLREVSGFSNRWGESVQAIKARHKTNLDLAVGLKRMEAAIADAKTEAERADLRSRLEAQPKPGPAVDFGAELAPVLVERDAYLAASQRYRAAVLALAGELPELKSAGARERAERLPELLRLLAESAEERERGLVAWEQFRPIGWFEEFNAFAFGRDWVTASLWQDWYGILPLLIGSFLIGSTALLLAIPFGVAAAIYVNQVARPAEARVVKPTLEFIAAIPSVVLGFFGVAVLGTSLRELSQLPWLSWMPGFPMQERLTALTAACLLGLMAVPTIFSLAEDAINNVPRAFKEASLALGATRLQTIARIIVPAALSGIIAAILLGLGRVLGETMVVLLCAGNRIQIPDFTAGLGVIVQPVHTMTGIIAQEMGEVPRGSIHYRALFSVGCVLFLLSLGINYTAQKLVLRYKLTGS